MMSRLSLLPAVGPAIYLAACVLVGGATQEGFIGTALLQVAGALTIGLALARTRGWTPASRQLLVLAALAAVAVLAELIPVPPSWWARLPERGGLPADYDLLGLPAPWLGLSLDPFATLSSGLMLIIPVAAALLVILAGKRARNWAIVVLIVVACLSIAMGALQIGGGLASRFYLYRNTNYDLATGFFSNTNHLGTLLLTTLPFVAAHALDDRNSRRRRHSTGGRSIMMLAVFAFLCCGIALNRSVAGFGLLPPVLLGSAALYLRGRGKLPDWRYVVAALISLIAIDLFMALGPLSDRLVDKAMSTSDPTMRHTSVTVTAHAAMRFFPFGSGLGSFLHVYPMFEDPSRVTATIVNHAHNEYVELLLETGVVGIALLSAFLIWFGVRAIDVWRRPTLQFRYAQAAVIAVGVLLLHSLVDYPGRTGAILGVIGLALGFLAAPEPAIAEPIAADEAATPREGRHLTID